MKHHLVAAITMAGALALAPATADARGGGHGGGGFHGGGFHGGGFGGFHGGGFRGAGFRGGFARAGAARGVAANRVTVRNVVGRGALAGRGFRDDRRFGFRRGFGYGGLGLGLGLAASDFGYGYWPDYYYGGAAAPAYGYAPVAYDPAAPAPAADPTATAMSSQVASCEARFKSYDPATGTYLGYDGKRHPCT